MAIPKSKDELILQGQANFQKLNHLVDSFTHKERHEEFKAGTMNRNIRDVLAHLHHWHLMLMEWYDVGMKGLKPNMPAKGYTWKDTKALNRMIWEKYQNHKLDEVRSALNQSFLDIQHMINKHSDEELFEKKKYAWTGSSSLSTYIRSNSSSHYHWAYCLIKKATR